MDVVVIELTNVGRAISPLKSAHSMLLTELVIAFVSGIIWPGFNSVAVLAILFPVTDVFGAVKMLISTSTLSFVIVPVALVYVTVSMDQSTFTVGLIVFPVADKLATIFPDLGSFSFSVTILDPLAMVNGAIVKFIRSSVN